MIDKETLDQIIATLHRGDGNLSAIVHRNLDPACPQEHIHEATQSYLEMRKLASILEGVRALAVLPKQHPLDYWLAELRITDKDSPEYQAMLEKYLSFLHEMDTIIPDDDEPADA